MSQQPATTPAPAATAPATATAAASGTQVAAAAATGAVEPKGVKIIRSVTQQLFSVLEGGDAMTQTSPPSSLRSLGAQGTDTSTTSQGQSTSGVMSVSPTTVATSGGGAAGPLEAGSAPVFAVEAPGARLNGSAATDTYKQLKQLLVLTESKTESLATTSFCETDETILTHFFEAVAPFVATDINVALFACSIVSNFCVFPDCRDVFDPTTLVDLATLSIASHPTQKKLVHLALMTLSNVALGGNVVLTELHAKTIASAIAPLYQEVRVVEAWASALGNLAACSPASTLNALVACNVIVALERLLTFHGDDARVAHRGLQALSHLCMGHIAVPASNE